MSTLITLVGQQPSAVAVTVATLAKNANLEWVVLMHTDGPKGTKKEACRLKSHIKGTHSNVEVDIFPIGKTSGYSSQDIISTILQDNRFPTPVYYDISPGLNFQVALIAQKFGNDGRLTPVYADNQYLRTVGTNNGNSKWDLEDITADDLFTLYDLQLPNPTNHSDIVDALGLDGELKSICIGAMVSRGRLYMLFDLRKNNGNPQQDERKRLLNCARKIGALQKEGIKKLRPVFSVWTKDSLTIKRLVGYGIDQIRDKCKNNAIQNWKAKITGNSSSPKTASNNITDCIENNYGTWEGNPLVVTLGNDPSSTLLAMFTHQPKKLILLVDKSSPRVCELAGRIANMVKSNDIPCPCIKFLGTDLYGNIDQALKNEIQSSKDEWEVNVSPGSKAHAWTLACLANELGNVTAWSLNNAARVRAAVPLNSGTGKSQKRYKFPSLLIQAGVSQGETVYEPIKQNSNGQIVTVKKYAGTSLDDLKLRKDFLVNFIRVISFKAKKNPQGYSRLPRTWRNGSVYGSGKNFIKRLGVYKAKEQTKEQIKFEASYNNKKEAGIINSPPDTAQYLEEPVAAAFLEAGGSCITDLRVGMMWPWLDARFSKINGKPVIRTEIDVVLLWDGCYIAISCKKGRPKDLDGQKAHIMAEARHGLGRFAIPVMVRGGIPHKKASDVAQESIKDRSSPLEIGLCLLNENGTLKDLIEEAINSRRTVN